MKPLIKHHSSQSDLHFYVIEMIYFNLTMCLLIFTFFLVTFGFAFCFLSRFSEKEGRLLV
jgi:uncharacterized membrane protein